MIVTLADAKAQCKIELDDDTQDAELTAFILAAHARVESELNRNVFTTTAEAEGDPDALTLDTMRHNGADLKLAALLLVGHYHRNREQVITGTIVSTLPEGFNALTGGHRLIPYGGRL